MDDPTLPTDQEIDSVCPWCSAALTGEPATCPSCGAILTSDKDRDLPGLTTVDVKAVSGQKRPPSRSRLLSWISGEYPDDVPTAAEVEADAHALAPPDPEVQREILRLELEAEVSELQAEADSIRSDALVEGRDVDQPDGEGDPPASEDDPPASEDETPA